MVAKRVGEPMDVQGISEEMLAHAGRWKKIHALWPDWRENLEEFGIQYRRNWDKWGFTQPTSADKWR